MATPRLRAPAGLLAGPYLFAVPYRVADVVRIWRDPWDLAVTYHAAGDIELLGDPQPHAVFSTAYELLFSMSAVVRSEETAARVLHSGDAGGQPFRFVSVADTPGPGPRVVSAAAGAYAPLLADIISVFGRLDGAPVTVILGSGMGGGLEGMFAYAILDPFDGDTSGVFGGVAAHEAVHFWVGVRTGDEDLPWWKEGTTTYLGYLFTARNGRCTRRYVEDGLLQNLDTLSAVRQYALNDPAVRANIYTPGSGFYELVYLKGGQVTMLLDRAVRDASAGAVSLDRVIARLCRDYRSRSFTRQEYVDEIRRLSGAGVGEILARHADTAGGIPDSVLVENFEALAARGAFGAASLGKKPRVRMFDPSTVPPFVPLRRAPAGQ
jgi:hypothetical protein